MTTPLNAARFRTTRRTVVCWELTTRMVRTSSTVRPNGHRRAGENAVRTVRVQTPRGFTSRGAPSHPQTGAWHQVGTAHGIAVHRGLDEAGKVKTRFEGRGDDTPHASGQRHIFNTQSLRDEAQDAAQRDIERNTFRRAAECGDDRVHDRRRAAPAATGSGKARASMASNAATPGRGEPDMRPSRSSQTSSSA